MLDRSTTEHTGLSLTELQLMTPTSFLLKGARSAR